MIQDHSALIARLNVNIQLLQEWNPDGTWQHNPLLLAYLRDRYCLKLSQADQLDQFLQAQVHDCEDNHRYKQQNLFEPTGDAAAAAAFAEYAIAMDAVADDEQLQREGL